MKKTKKLLFIFPLLFIGLLFSGCSSPVSQNKESKFTLHGCPAGNLGVLVYSSNTLPTNRMEYNERRAERTIAASRTMTSPFTLAWLDSIYSGNRFVVIVSITGTSTNYLKFGLATFDSKGNASLYWDTMKDYSSLPY